MTAEFWWGLAALPIALALVAAASAALFGSWKLFESWANRRYTRLRNVSMPDKMPFGNVWTMPNLGGREAMAALTLTSRTVGLFRFTGNCGIIIVRGKPGEPTDDVAILTKAIPRAVSDLAQEAADAAQHTPKENS